MLVYVHSYVKSDLEPWQHQRVKLPSICVRWLDVVKVSVSDKYGVVDGIAVFW